MATPIIIPVQQPPREVDCIVQDGVRYCEKKDLKPKEVGTIVIALTLWIGLIILVMTRAIDNDWPLPMLWPLLIFIAPFVLMLFL